MRDASNTSARPRRTLLRAGFAALCLAAACALGGCAAGGAATSGAFAMATDGGGQTIAFESIDGPPPQVFDRMVSVLDSETKLRSLSIVSREGSAAYRVRSYLSAQVVHGRTVIAWVWDVYDRDQQRALRLSGEEPAGKAGRDPWAAADDLVLRKIAQAGLSGLSSMVNGTPADARRPPPRPPASAGPRSPVSMRPQPRAAPILRPLATPTISQIPEMAPIFARENRRSRVASGAIGLIFPRSSKTPVPGKPDMLNKVSSNVAGRSLDVGQERLHQADCRQFQSGAGAGDRRRARRSRSPRPWSGASPTWRSSSRSRRTSAARTPSSCSRPRFRPTTI